MRITSVKSVKDAYLKYERYISPIALLSGFVLDVLTFKRIDLWVENLRLIIYLLVAVLSMLLVNAYYTKHLRSRIFEKLMYLAPFAMQFAFGGLFSAFVIFYSKSSSLLNSWPFLVILVFLLVGNEVFRERYIRFVFQLVVFFTALYSYLIFALPILFNKMGPGIFILSGLVVLCLIGLVVYAFYRIAPNKFYQSRKPLFFGLGSIFLIFNLFYFLNIMPPVPLALKDIGIFNRVERTSQGYYVSYEPNPWYAFYKKYNSNFKWPGSGQIYCFSSVFAPGDFNLPIFHRWSYFDQEKGKWIEKSRLRFQIIGGRDNGYRGYTYKSSFQPGKWRVQVTNERGQILGRVDFRIVKVDKLPELKTEIY